MQKCILCGKPTDGSVGATGIHWPNLCQPCKDKEDAALANTIKMQSRIIQVLNLGEKHDSR